MTEQVSHVHMAVLLSYLRGCVCPLSLTPALEVHEICSSSRGVPSSRLTAARVPPQKRKVTLYRQSMPVGIMLAIRNMKHGGLQQGNSTEGKQRVCFRSPISRLDD
jgi:hypothetical protein